MTKKDATPKPKKWKFRFNVMFTNGIPLTIDCDVVSGMEEVSPFMKFYSDEDKPKHVLYEKRKPWHPFFIVNKRHVMYIGRMKV